MIYLKTHFNDTKNRFDKGLVSELELISSNIEYLNAQKNYYESLQELFKNLYKLRS
ncbi:MAG: hypothetical protein ACOX1K_00315 [Defluviitoga tunisiensis]